MKDADGKRCLRSLPRIRSAFLTASSLSFYLSAGAAASTADLQTQLAERDARIEALTRRLDALEKKLSEGQPSANASAPAERPSEHSTRDASGNAPTGQRVTQSNNTSARGASVKEATAAQQRALERTLVLEGGLVLPSGVWEVEPQVRYTYRSFQGLGLVESGGQLAVASQDEQSHILEPSMAVRYGLPWQSQLELRIPYAYIRTKSTSGPDERRDRTSGLGDVELLFNKQVLNESKRSPGLLASIAYRAATGRTADVGFLAPGQGYKSVQTTLTGVKRADPMFFFGSISYSINGAHGSGEQRLDRGNAFGVRVGSVLAASATTSLRLGLEIVHSERARLGGVRVPGSDATDAMLEIGVSNLLSPRHLLSTQLGVGLTKDSPDFQLTVALPTRL